MAGRKNRIANKVAIIFLKLLIIKSIRLIFACVRIAREGNHVADVLHAGHEEHEAFESESESGMGHAAVAAGVEIPIHSLETGLFDAGKQLVIVGFAFGAADDLADFREEHVHAAHGLAVVVELHIEGFDLLRIVGHDHGALEMLLHQIALML